MSEFYMRYVPHEAVASYEAVGWRAIAPTPGAHGVYSTLMKWEGEGEPPAPISEDERWARALDSVRETEDAL